MADHYTEKNMKKCLVELFILVFVIVIFLESYVYADSAMPTYIEVVVNNPPSEDYCIALLAESFEKKVPQKYDYSTKTDADNYILTETDQEMLRVLYEYADDGWTVMSRSFHNPNNLEFFHSNEAHKYHFHYLLDLYKVIIVTENLEISVSKEAIMRGTTRINSTCYYDADTGELSGQNNQGNDISYNTVKGIVCALVLTLLVESVVICFFGLQSIANFIRIIIVNVITQAFLDLYMFFVFVRLSFINAALPYVVLFTVELLIIFAEAMCYKKRLKYNDEIHPVRNVAYTIVANAASFGIGMLIL